MNMKFIRKARRQLWLRDRAIDLLSKALLIGISVLACLWMVSGAHAATPAAITGIQAHSLGDGSVAVDFALSKKISTEDVAVDFDRNFIQVSLKGVTAYPARTESLGGGTLEKVFTYQYQPDLARARVLLRTTAASLRDSSSWSLTSGGLRLTVRGAALTAAVVSDSLKIKASATTAGAGAKSSGELATSDKEEERIVQEILDESRKGAKSPVAAKALEQAPFAGDVHAEKAVLNEDVVLFPAKPAETKAKDNPISRVLASLLLVLGVIGACAVAYRRFMLGRGAPFQRSGRVIETIATQGLGPKRSVALIKVLDQYLVVGMAGDSMSLLSNLGADVKIEKFLDAAVGGPGASFTDTLEGALKGIVAKPERTDSAGPPLTHKAAQIELGIRSSIKKRIAGFKPL